MSTELRLIALTQALQALCEKQQLTCDELVTLKYDTHVLLTESLSDRVREALNEIFDTLEEALESMPLLDNLKLETLQ